MMLFSAGEVLFDDGGEILLGDFTSVPFIEGLRGVEAILDLVMLPAAPTADGDI